MDEQINLRELVKFMQKYDINYKICDSITDVQAIERQQVTGIIMTGSYLRVSNDYNHPKTLTSVYVLTDYQSLSIIPIYGLCFSCQLATVIHGGSLHQLPSLYHQNVRTQLNTNIDILHNRSKAHLHVGFNDLPIPTKYSKKYFIETSWDLTRYYGAPLSYKYKNKPWYFSMYHPEERTKTHWILLNFIQNICHENATIAE